MIKIKLLLIILFTFMSINSVQAFNLFGKKNMGFRFEDYKNAEEAEEALLKLHAVGSDVSTLKKTLEDAGASCGLFNMRTGQKVMNLAKKEHAMRCSYTQKKFILFYEWAVFIEGKNGSPMEINSIKVINELVTL